MNAYIFKDSARKWMAAIDGPWYDDSNPEGQAETQEEAKNLAWERLLELQQEVNEFVAKGKPEFELTK